MIKIKRIYDEPSEDDGFRVLVDRLWPRGVSKEEARLDRWMREIAPSDELRREFRHDPAWWEEFRRRYEAELDDKSDDVAFLQEKSEETDVTLLYAAEDTEHNNALALRMYLERQP